MIFVFGSNLAGRHGAGSALHAVKNFGAIRGIGVGPQGNSYAIPTKDQNLNTMSLDWISLYVKQFLEYARLNPQKEFQIVAIGCGLAGYTAKDIAPLFLGYSTNCTLPKEFLDVLAENNAPF